MRTHPNVFVGRDVPLPGAWKAGRAPATATVVALALLKGDIPGLLRTCGVDEQQARTVTQALRRCHVTQIPGDVAAVFQSGAASAIRCGVYLWGRACEGAEVLRADQGGTLTPIGRFRGSGPSLSVVAEPDPGGGHPGRVRAP